ncbi:HigA family addiction module antitoxin [Corynebacterium ulceribovis]|uniref:HigA family addiction module antitoxin n=1 Tax=Corynebacterium ulceribovis TaxID=487732 RepID=UPI00036B2374|nr:HigA family addiction module antitoxin [Corynebacterium ulceribovis]
MARTAVAHPGTVLAQDFLAPRNLSIYYLAVSIDVPSSQLGRFIAGQRPATPDLDQRLTEFFGTRPGHWTNLQRQFEAN